MAKDPSTLRVSGTHCKLTSSMVKRVIVNMTIRKYKKTISVRVNPLGTIANTINTNQANKARTTMDIGIIPSRKLTDTGNIPNSHKKIYSNGKL